MKRIYSISSMEEAYTLLRKIEQRVEVLDKMRKNVEKDNLNLWIEYNLSEALRELLKEKDDIEGFVKQNTGGTPYEQQ